MKLLRNIVMVAVGVLAAAFVFLRFGIFPYEDLRYRLAITVNVDGKDYSGSSVMQVRYTDPADIFPMNRKGAGLTGQALTIDLGQDRALVALLIAPPGSRVAGDYRAYPTAIPVKEFKIARSIGALKLSAVRRVRTEGAKARVPVGALPLLVYLPNVNDPASAKLVDPNDLAATLGDHARIVSADAETVDMGLWPLREFFDTGVPVTFYDALRKDGYNPGSSMDLVTLFIQKPN